jgi:hypothetical protein
VQLRLQFGWLRDRVTDTTPAGFPAWLWVTGVTLTLPYELSAKYLATDLPVVLKAAWFQ